MMSGASIRSRAPRAKSPTVRRVMLRNRGDELVPERQLRSQLHRIGIRFRRNCRPIDDFRCSADIVFPRERVCVFVDGCFWHGCPRHFVCPKTHADWWQEKIASTKARDKQQTAKLRAANWRVIRVWEHDLRSDTARALDRICNALAKATGAMVARERQVRPGNGVRKRPAKPERWVRQRGVLPEL